MQEKTNNPFTVLLKSWGLEPFVLALAGMIGLAALYPAPGLVEGPFSLKELTNYGVSLVFLFYGLRLNSARLLSDLKNWRLHLLIQFTTFIFFPLLILAIQHFVGPGSTVCCGWESFFCLFCRLRFPPRW